MSSLLIQLIARILDPEAKRFFTALKNPEWAQRRVQTQILGKLRNTAYGKHFGIRSIDDWDKLPIVGYDDLKPWIDQQRYSQSSVLTPDQVLFYERTSGSQGAVKWIPYTSALRRSFHHLFCVWAHDLIRHGPRFQSGRSYISVTPAFAAANGVTNEKRKDSDYVEGWLQWMLSPFLVTVPGAQKIKDIETFKYQLCLRLLQEESLEILSVWSPTFLRIHLDYIQDHQQELLSQLRNQLSSKRVKALAQSPIPWTELWPDLKLISCWDQAHATEPAAFLRKIFPGVTIQGKGLLATEAPMTVPLIATQSFSPLLDEIFFEFEDEAGTLFPLTQLKNGAAYSLILSQKGGLYRYRIGDRIQVTGYYHNTPCLEFLGRDLQVSDLVGEKLHECFVNQQLRFLPSPNPCFRCLVPCLTPRPHYQLILDQPDPEMAVMVQHLDRALQTSPHYQLARQLGQLGPIQGVVEPQILEILTRARLQSGCQWGDIKMPSFCSQPLEQLWRTESNPAAKLAPNFPGT